MSRHLLFLEAADLLHWTLVFTLALVLLLAGAQRSVRTVTNTAHALSYERVPQSWRHLVRDQIAGPYYFAISDGMVCLIDDRTYYRVRRHDRLACDWRMPRP